MSVIPPEYQTSNFDFGFSAVDEIEAVGVPQPPVATTTAVNEVKEAVDARLLNLEGSVADMKEVLLRIENSLVSNLDTDEYKALIERDIKDKLKQVESMVMPLLINLMKNPDKDYIKWPNRKPMIEDFIQKLLLVTR